MLLRCCWQAFDLCPEIMHLHPSRTWLEVVADQIGKNLVLQVLETAATLTPIKVQAYLAAQCVVCTAQLRCLQVFLV